MRAYEYICNKGQQTEMTVVLKATAVESAVKRVIEMVGVAAKIRLVRVVSVAELDGMGVLS